MAKVVHHTTPRAQDMSSGDLEKAGTADSLGAHTPNFAFVGRVGGNQLFTVDRQDAANAAVLAKEPDAAPGMTLSEQFDLKPFTTVRLWKAALMEGMGECQWVRKECGAD